jgi:hypothetical protein
LGEVEMKQSKKKLSRLRKNKTARFEAAEERKLRLEKNLGIVRVEKRTDSNKCNGKIVSA